MPGFGRQPRTGVRHAGPGPAALRRGRDPPRHATGRALGGGGRRAAVRRHPSGRPGGHRRRRHRRLDITVRSEIPVARGLGSSAALAVAAAAAAGAADPFESGRPSTATPRTRPPPCSGDWSPPPWWAGSRRASPLPLDDGFASWCWSPTGRCPRRPPARRCPGRCPTATPSSTSAAWVCSSPGLPIRRRLVREATEDRLHEPARTPLFPEAPALLAGLVEAGAPAACWSGAGPSLLAFCDRESAPVVRERRRAVAGGGAASRRRASRPVASGHSRVWWSSRSDGGVGSPVPLEPSRDLIAIPNPHPGPRLRGALRDE